MQMIRRLGALVLILAAVAVWFGMKPVSTDTSSNYGAAITAALADDTANNARTEGAPQQTVVNGWTAKNLLTIIAKEGADPQPVDERPAALLTLLVIGFGLGLATSGSPVSVDVQEQGTSSWPPAGNFSRPWTTSKARDQVSPRAMVGGGMGLLAISLLYLLYTVVTSVLDVSRMNVGLYYFPYYLLHLSVDNWLHAFVWPVLCLILSVAAALLMIAGKRKGAAVWRVNRRVPTETVAWAVAGLYLAGIVASELLPPMA